MKHKILLAAITVLSLTTKAQISKGTVFIGGGGMFSNTNSGDDNDKYKERTTYLTPAVGWAVKDNLVTGVELSYNRYKYSRGFDDLMHSETSYGGGFFVRKYFPVISKLYVFVHGNVEGAGTRVKNNSKSSGLETGKGWTTAINLYPGVSFGINKKVHIESGFNNLLSARYSIVKFTSTTNTPRKIENYGAGVSFDNYSQFYVGFRFLLPG